MLDEINTIFSMTYPTKMVNKHLDIGTGNGERIRYLKARKRLYNDASKDAMSGTVPQPCFWGNALDMLEFLKPRQFDVITGFDVIEHLRKEDGYALLKRLEALSKGRIILFTPLGDLWIGQDARAHQTHLCGWYPEELTEVGYSCWVFPNFHETLSCGAFFAIKDTKLLKPLAYKSSTPSYVENYWVEAE